MNYGIKQATGKAVAFIGGDDIADKNWIKEIRKALKTADIVVGDHISKEGERVKNIQNVNIRKFGWHILLNRRFFIRILRNIFIF